MRTAVKKVQTSTDREEAGPLLSSAASAIDKAARTGAVHRGKADRQKSQLARHVNSLTQDSR
jgi:small subunit ribosomal protein S20